MITTCFVRCFLIGEQVPSFFLQETSVPVLCYLTIPQAHQPSVAFGRDL